MEDPIVVLKWEDPPLIKWGSLVKPKVKWSKPPRRVGGGPPRGTPNRETRDKRGYKFANPKRINKPCPGGPHTESHCDLCAYSGHFYNNGCRCDPCRSAHAARVCRNRDDRARRLALDPSIVKHGLSTTYRNWGCRCEDCTTAHSAQCREYGKKRRAREKRRARRVAART